MAVLWQCQGSVTAVLRQCYGCVTAVLWQYYGSVMAVLWQYYTPNKSLNKLQYSTNLRCINLFGGDNLLQLKTPGVIDADTIFTIGGEPICGKCPHVLLWVGSRAAR